jgi:hypothetical protein
VITFTDGMIAGNANGAEFNRPPSPGDTDPAAVFVKSSPNVTGGGSSASKFEKKIIDEIVKLFQENNGSFYFASTYDLTNSIERQQEQIEAAENCEETPPSSYWRKCDDRFFWNKVLLGDLLNSLSNQSELVGRDRFILPLIQGFVQIHTYENKTSASESQQRASLNLLEHGERKVRIGLISRRNRYRLGTRFRRRGIDDNGNVANFVETEQVRIKI